MLNLFLKRIIHINQQFLLWGMDKKYLYIITLVAIIFFFLSYVATINYNERQRLAIENGFREGRFFEQKNALAQLQATGVYTISVIDEKNETQLVRLGIIQSMNFKPEE